MRSTMELLYKKLQNTWFLDTYNATTTTYPEGSGEVGCTQTVPLLWIHIMHDIIIMKYKQLYRQKINILQLIERI